MEIKLKNKKEPTGRHKKRQWRAACETMGWAGGAGANGELSETMSDRQYRVDWIWKQGGSHTLWSETDIFLSTRTHTHTHTHTYTQLQKHLLYIIPPAHSQEWITHTLLLSSREVWRQQKFIVINMTKLYQHDTGDNEENQVNTQMWVKGNQLKIVQSTHGFFSDHRNWWCLALSHPFIIVQTHKMNKYNKTYPNCSKPLIAEENNPLILLTVNSSSACYKWHYRNPVH